MDPSQQQTMAQFLTTEHFVLQTAKSAAIAESNGRASLFLGSVSSGVVALALVAQVSEVGPAFYGFAAVILPVLFFLGLVTFARVATSSLEFWIHSRSIYRLRRFYLDAVPEVAKYLVFPDEDFFSIAKAQGIRRGRTQIFLTLPGSIAVITSVIAGVFVGLTVALVTHPHPAAGGGAGVLSFFLVAYLLLSSQGRRFRSTMNMDLSAE